MQQVVSYTIFLCTEYSATAVILSCLYFSILVIKLLSAEQSALELITRSIAGISTKMSQPLFATCPEYPSNIVRTSTNSSCVFAYALPATIYSTISLAEVQTACSPSMLISRGKELFFNESTRLSFDVLSFKISIIVSKTLIKFSVSSAAFSSSASLFLRRLKTASPKDSLMDAFSSIFVRTKIAEFTKFSWYMDCNPSRLCSL